MKSICALFIALFSFSMMTSATPAPWMINKTISKKKTATLGAGTLIMLELSEDLHSVELTTGQLIHLKVSANVYAGKKIAIAEGALALGRVKSISQASYNGPASITLEVSKVQSVDGQMINMNPQEQSFKGKFPGQGFTLNHGKTMTATVLNDAKVKVN